MLKKAKFCFDLMLQFIIYMKYCERYM